MNTLEVMEKTLMDSPTLEKGIILARPPRADELHNVSEHANFVLKSLVHIDRVLPNDRVLHNDQVLHNNRLLHNGGVLHNDLELDNDRVLHAEGVLHNRGVLHND